MTISSWFRFVILVLVLGGTACDSKAGKILRGIGESTTVLDPPPAAPVALDLLCDSSVGSTCTEKNLAATLDAVLPTVAARPTSTILLWELGDTVAQTRIVAEATATPSPRPSLQVVRTHQQRFVVQTKTLLVQAAQPLVDHPSRRSPIAEAIAKIALNTTAPGVGRIIVILSDGREESGFGHLECGPIPQPEDFLQRLHEASVLTPNSLAGVRVRWSFFTLEPVPGKRCASTISRYQRTQAVWTAVLSSAGADATLSTSTPTDLVAERSKR
jgi:hypothetical protein